MPLACFALQPLLRLLVLLLPLLVPLGAHADEYADVNRLLRSGKHPEALARAERYLADKPRDPQMRFLRGVILSETGRSAEALATYVALVQDYPELPEPYNNLAVLYAGQKEFHKAKEALEMAIRTNPAYVTAHENLGDVYVQLARQSYARALQLDPTSSSARAKLAQSAAALPTAPAAPARTP